MKNRRTKSPGLAWRSIAALVMTSCIVTTVECPAVERTTETPIRYVPLDAPVGMSQAVIVQRMPLVHTRQLLSMDREGKLVGVDSVDEQIEQVLDNLESVLRDSGSGLDKLIRLNVYALSTTTVSSFREHLSKRLDPSVRPAITSVLTPLAHRQAMVAVDAVAGAVDSGKTVAQKRCQSVAGNDECADAAVLPAGGIAYLSGQPEEAGLTELPTTKSMANLMKTLGHLNLSPRHVVQVKVFLKPVTSAEEVLREMQKFFPDQITPPVVFVEWLASMPIEIEMIAQLPLSDKPAEKVEYFTPLEFRPSNVFSKVALMRAEHQIYISSLYARVPSRGEPQAKYLFQQLEEILTNTGSDMHHLVKATYYVSDHDAARWVDRTRPRIYDPLRPPAASKVTVHGVGQAKRTMSVDMIAVGSE
ncbi:MAG: RidA family protein [Pirellulales bacterium]